STATKIVHLGPTAARPLRRPEVDDDDHVEAEDAAPVESVPAATIEEREDIGLLPNWSAYDVAEQLHRMDSLAHRPDVLSLMYALTPVSHSAALFERTWIERAKDLGLSLESLSRRDLPSGRIIVGVDPATSSSPRASWFVAIPVLFVPATKT